MGGVRSTPDTSAPQARLPPRAYYALTVLTALNVINVWHRYLIYNLSAVSVEDCDVCDDVSFIPLCYIEEETSSASEEECLSCRNSYNTEFYNLKDGACIDNTQYGILAGVGFTLMFALATLFAGRLTDTLNRRLLHTSAILVWSLAAAAHGTCENFSCLLVSRVFLGIGEAFNAPACYALITLYFPHSRRATANGIYSTGTYLGSAISSLCLAVAVLLGWRNTAFISGAFGVLTGAVLFFTVEHNPVMPPTAIGYTKLPDDPNPSTQDVYSTAIISKATTNGHAYSRDDGSGGSNVVGYGNDGYGNGGYGSGGYSGGVAVIPPYPNGNGAVPADAAGGYHASAPIYPKPKAKNGTGNGIGPTPVALPNFPGAPVVAAAAVGGGSSHPPAGESSTAPDSPRFLIVDESPLAGEGVGSGSAGGGQRSATSKISRRSRAPVEGKDLRDCNNHNSDHCRHNRLLSADNSYQENPFAQGSDQAVGSDSDESPSRSAARPLLTGTPSYGDGAGYTPRGDGGGNGTGVGGRAPREGGEEGVDRCVCCPTDGLNCRRGFGAGGGGSRRRGLRREKSFELDRGRGCGRGGALAAAGAPVPTAVPRCVRGVNTDMNGGDYGWFEDDPSGSSVEAGGGDLDPRGGGGGGAKHDLRQTLRTIGSNRVVLVLFAASSARMVATWSMAGYMAIYYHRAFPSQISLYSVLNAVFVSIGGMASSYGGGAISDRLRIRNEGILGYLPALGSAAAILPLTVVLFSSSFGVSVTALFLTYLTGECWLGPGMALLQMELPKEMAGTSVAILLFLNSVLCNIGPWFIAWRDSGLPSVRRPMFAMILLSYVSSFFLFTAVGFMVSHKHRRRLEMEGIVMDHAEGLLEDGDADDPGGGGGGDASWRKSAAYYFQGSRFDNFVERNHRGSGGGEEPHPYVPYGAVENRDRSRIAVSMCEMVRRTFSGTASSTGEFNGEGGGSGRASGTGLSNYVRNDSERREQPRPRGRAATRATRGVRGERRRGTSGGASVGGRHTKKRSSKDGVGGGAAEAGNGEREELLGDTWASGEGPGRRV